MANAKTYRLDPNCLTQQALDGTAQLITDPTSAMWGQIFAEVNRSAGYETVDTTGAALALDVVLSELSVTGTDAHTLAAPTYAGQKKIVRCVLAASIPLGTLTITSPDDTAGFVCEPTFLFDTVGQEITLEATAALKWRCVGKRRAGVLATITAGTTVLTSRSLHAVYSLAVDGTDAGTGTTGMPNGSCVGEEMSIVCELAANTPVGSLGGLYAGVFGTAHTVFGAIGVVGSATVIGDYGHFVWNGSAWQVRTFAGCTLS
jgi:hypothetical protein